MRLLLALCTIFLGSSRLMIFAQPRPFVRHITITAVASGGPTRAFTPIEFATIAAEWKRSQVPLELERPLDLAAVASAKAVISRLYAREGHSVGVEHVISNIEPRSLQVAFKVVELCTH